MLEPAVLLPYIIDLSLKKDVLLFEISHDFICEFVCRNSAMLS